MWVTANVGERRICRLKFYLLLPKSMLYTCHMIGVLLTFHLKRKIIIIMHLHKHILNINTEYSLSKKNPVLE